MDMAVRTACSRELTDWYRSQFRHKHVPWAAAEEYKAARCNASSGGARGGGARRTECSLVVITEHGTYVLSYEAVISHDRPCDDGHG